MYNASMREARMHLVFGATHTRTTSTRPHVHAKTILLHPFLEINRELLRRTVESLTESMYGLDSAALHDLVSATVIQLFKRNG